MNRCFPWPMIRWSFLICLFSIFADAAEINSLLFAKQKTTVVDEKQILTDTTKPIRVACLGTSITLFSGKTSYPSQLQEILGNAYEVMNFGKSGTTVLNNSVWSYRRSNEYRQAVQSGADVFIIELGTNDSKSDIWENRVNFIASYELLLDTLLHLPSSPAVFICLPGKAFTHGFGIDSTVLQSDIIPAISGIAYQKGINLIDLYSTSKSKRNLFPDGIHPDSAGCHLIAEKVATLLHKIPYFIHWQNDSLSAPPAYYYQWYENSFIVKNSNTSAIAVSESKKYTVGIGITDSTDDFLISQPYFTILTNIDQDNEQSTFPESLTSYQIFKNKVLEQQRNHGDKFLISITDLSGKIIYQQKFNQSQDLLLQVEDEFNRLSGCYIVKISRSDCTFLTERVMTE